MDVITHSYPSKIRFKLRSRKISFTRNIHNKQRIFLKFCTEHDNIIQQAS